MNKKVKTEELFDCQNPLLSAFFKENIYPWEMIPKIGEWINRIWEKGALGYKFISEGVLVGEGVRISELATVLPPAVIGKGTEIRPGAYLRGNVIVGEKCVIGNATELKNCILLDGVQAPHYNYIGDSVLGNGAHLGAGAICSNLKSDGKNVVIRGEEEYDTRLRKLGAVLGDGADIGCGSVLNPGTVVGKKTSVYPLTFLRGVYPEGCIVKNSGQIIKRKIPITK